SYFGILIDAQGLIDQICALEIQAHGSSSATLGSDGGSASATSTPTQTAPSQIRTPTSTTPSLINVPSATAPSATPTSTTPSLINVPSATAPSATPMASNNPSKSMASRTLGASLLRSVLKAAYVAISAAWLLAGLTLI
ncbi:hypothetical protein MMC27_008821, partial [Xylographa pallens]|nr:hypothetical protein [Xylographa pallens]